MIFWMPVWQTRIIQAFTSRTVMIMNFSGYSPQRLPRALLIAIGVALLLLIAGIAFSSASSRQWRELARAEEAGFARSESHATTAERLVLRLFDDLAGYFSLALRWSDISRVGGEGFAERTGQLMLEEMAESSDIMDEAFIMTAGGRLFAPARHAGHAADSIRQIALQATSSGMPFYVGLLRPTEVQQDVNLALVIRLQHRDGTFAGQGIAVIRPEALSATLATFGAQDAGNTSVLRREGELVARHQMVDHLIGRAILPATIRALVATQQQGTLRGTSFITEREYLAAWRAIPDTNLIVVVSVDAERARAPALAAGRMAYVVALVLVVTSALLVTMTLVWLWRAAERAGRTEIERLHVGLPAVIFVAHVGADGSYRRLYRSGDIERVTGWSPRQLAGRRLHELHNGVGETLDSYTRRALRDGDAVADWEINEPGGGIRTMRSHVRPMTKEPNGGGIIVGYILDVSNEKAAQLQTIAAARMTSVGEMATGLAHELNQPLTVISLAAENMQRAIERRGAAALPDVLARIARIEVQTLRARDLIEHLRLFARAEDGAGPIEHFPLLASVRGALRLIMASLRESRITVDVRIPSDLPFVAGRLVPLQQVCLNVLLNARDAIVEAGGDDGRIEIAAHQRDDKIILSITDNGCGICQDLLPRIFEPFFTTKAPGSGTGLGLSIGRSILQAMGASIAAASTDRGAIFTITLRVASSTGPDVAMVEPAAVKA